MDEMLLRAWKWYQNCLAVHPVKTQVISSGVIWGLGDISAQAVTHYTAKTHHNLPPVTNPIDLQFVCLYLILIALMFLIVVWQMGIVGVC